MHIVPNHQMSETRSPSYRFLRSLSVILTAALAVSAGHTPAGAQDLGAVTRPGPQKLVLLLWSADTSSPTKVRYNIYRKLLSDATFGTTPINTTPVAPVTDTTLFKTFIPRGSDDWNAISSALADSVGGRNPVRRLVNVFSITSIPRSNIHWRRVQALAAIRPAIAHVMGQAYRDSLMTVGTYYLYKLIRVPVGAPELLPTGNNTALVKAGFPDSVPAPDSVRIVAGDAKIQILWNKPLSRFAAFDVLRSNSSTGFFAKVSDVDFSVDIIRTIDSVTISPTANGFTDYQRWDSAGNPITHKVPGNTVEVGGPANGVTYWYQVRLKDVLGNTGPLSSPIHGMALDSTPPATPGDIFVDALESSSSFRIRWSRVRLDINGHRDSIVSYKAYRYTRADDPSSGAVVVSPDIPQPSFLDSTRILMKEDSTAGLRSACRDSTLYFRVEAWDAAGNASRRSIAVGAALKDTTRPANVRGTKAEGFDDFIRVSWILNDDCDIDEYLIYRAYCDYGSWHPCISASAATTLKVPLPTYNEKRGDCGGPFTLLGTISHRNAKMLGNPTYIDDRSVDPKSPVCYAYIVKAQDRSQNISGTFPIPTVPPEIIVCQRIRDRTPPEPAVIAGLLSRDSAIVVDFIGPPVQDIAAYHVYRSDSSANGPYHWVGGTTVVPPPGTGVPLTAPYIPPHLVSCDSIPLVSNPYMSAGRFIDKKVDRKHIYWYKVLGVDRNGNQSGPDSALSVSTFTFASHRPASPTILSVVATDNPCALTLTWSPLYDSTAIRGFFVFRSSTAAGPSYQLGGLLKGNTFIDRSVARNTSYFYRLVAMGKDGVLTELSEPHVGLHP